LGNLYVIGALERIHLVGMRFEHALDLVIVFLLKGANLRLVPLLLLSAVTLETQIIRSGLFDLAGHSFA
jgi:hypothetical protein